MKLRIIYFLFFAFLTSGLFLNYKDGPAGRNDEDRTGGPFSDAPCQTCHAAGAFSPVNSALVVAAGLCTWFVAIMRCL